MQRAYYEPLVFIIIHYYGYWFSVVNTFLFRIPYHMSIV